MLNLYVFEEIRLADANLFILNEIATIVRTLLQVKWNHCIYLLCRQLGERFLYCLGKVAPDSEVGIDSTYVATRTNAWLFATIITLLHLDNWCVCHWAEEVFDLAVHMWVVFVNENTR